MCVVLQLLYMHDLSFYYLGYFSSIVEDLKLTYSDVLEPNVQVKEFCTRNQLLKEIVLQYE